jgi:hypothetical protein
METVESTSLPTRAPLRPSGWVGQYTFSFFLAGISVCCIYWGVADLIGGKKHPTNMWLPAILSATLATILGYARRRRLRYTVFQTLDGSAENYRKVLEVAVSSDWDICDDKKNALIAARIKAPWTALTWGELVTVQFSGSLVGINVIGDPYAGGSGSRTDAARARAEMDTVIHVLRVI